MNKEEELQETINRINRLYMECRQSKRSLSRRLNDCLRRERINIKIVKKYFLISSKSKFIFVKISLFIKMFFGLLKDKI